MNKYEPTISVRKLVGLDVFIYLYNFASGALLVHNRLQRFSILFFWAKTVVLADFTKSFRLQILAKF